MIPEKAVRKAAEGGFDVNSYLGEGDSVESWLRYDCEHDWQRLALDPLFFQALGKALGWEDYQSINFMKDTLSFANGTVFGWRAAALRFYDLILNGGDTEKFWQELLAN